MLFCQGCLKCHPECRTCNGPGLSFCTECLHLREDKKCVSNCSVDYFYDAENDVCSPCSSHCHRCTGPTAADCVACRHFKLIYRTAKHDQDTVEVLIIDTLITLHMLSSKKMFVFSTC